MSSSNLNRTLLPPPPLVVLVGWLVPGAGYWLIGQRARGTVVGVTILLMFLFGLLIGGMRVVDSAFIESQQEQKDRERKEEPAREDARRSGQAYSPPSLGVRVLQKPWFIGQFFAGPVALISDWIGTTWEHRERPRGEGEYNAGSPFSHARVYEIGVLYTAVAGMLNLMAIIDSAYRAANGGAR